MCSRCGFTLIYIFAAQQALTQASKQDWNDDFMEMFVK
jgi:hypothetical protein